MTRKQEAARVAAWNKKHPAGTAVYRYESVNPRAGAEFRTKTRSEAWLLGGHTAVVLVDGMTGAVPLDALEIA